MLRSFSFFRMSTVLLVCVTFALSGCLISSSSSNRGEGTRIKEHTLKQFEPGTTTKEWTLAVLGSPNKHEALDDGREILRYEYSRKVHSDTTVFLLFSGSSNKTEKQTVYFEFKDQVLSRYWVEHD